MRFVLSTILTVGLLAACSEKLTVEQQIIATLRNMEYAAEEGQHLSFMGHVAETFAGRQGSMDRREFHRFMIFQMNENRRLHATFFPIHVREDSQKIENEIDGTSGRARASARFRLLVTGGGGLLPDRGQLFEVNTNWILENGDWLLLSADWEPVRMPE